MFIVIIDIIRVVKAIIIIEAIIVVIEVAVMAIINFEFIITPLIIV